MQIILKIILVFTSSVAALLISYAFVLESCIQKALRYGKTYTLSGLDLRIVSLIDSACRWFVYSKAERKAIAALFKIKDQGETIWHHAIREAFDKGGRADMRKLISQLQTEAAPVPKAMKKILTEAFEPVMAVKTLKIA